MKPCKQPNATLCIEQLWMFAAGYRDPFSFCRLWRLPRGAFSWRCTPDYRPSSSTSLSYQPQKWARLNILHLMKMSQLWVIWRLKVSQFTDFILIQIRVVGWILCSSLSINNVYILFTTVQALVQNLPLTSKKRSVLAWSVLAWPGQCGTFVLKSTGGFE